MAATKLWKKVMVPLGQYWNQHCDEKSKAEGWALFNTGDELLIQKIDEPEEGEPELKNDAEAYELCCQKALTGSKLHLLALFLDGRPDNNKGTDVPRCLIEK